MKKDKCELCAKRSRTKECFGDLERTLSRILWRSKNEIGIYVLKASKQENTSGSMEMNDRMNTVFGDHKEEVS